MKLPITPPKLQALLNLIEPGRILELATTPAIREIHCHYWDMLRHLSPPQGLSHEEWWLTLKLGRLKNWRKIAGLISTSGQLFFYTLPDCVLEIIHDIDSRARGHVAVHHQYRQP